MPEVENIQEAVQRVINQRKGLGEFEGQGHLAKIDTMKSIYKGLLTRVEEFEEFRQLLLAQANAEQGQYYVYFKEDPMLINRVEDASASETIDKIKECIRVCEHLHERFNRDTLNISVIGRARQGKSRLLQSISGLTNEVIPAAKGGDCTGTTSLIRNAAGQTETRAVIKFYSKEEMVEIVKAYLDQLGLTNSVPTFDSIPLLSTFIEGSRAKLLNDFDANKQSLFIHMCKYVEHFDEYNKWVKEGEAEVQEDKIREFVAQYTADNTKVYNYLAVKEVTIYTEFKMPQVGKIVLVDTIGLGDTSLGIEDKMLHTLRENSDAAFLVRFPSKDGEDWRKEDGELHKLIERAMGREMLDKWLYFVLNLDSEGGNRDSIEAFKKSINDRKLHFAETVEVDCTDSEAVYSRLLLPALNRLSTNLIEVDNNLMEGANLTFTDCFASYQELYDAANRISENSPAIRNQLAMFGVIKWEDIKKRLTTSLGELATEYADKEDYPNYESITALDEARKNIYCHIPPENWYLESLRTMGINAGPAATYELGCNITRSHISQEFAKAHFEVLHNLEFLFKWRVANIFYETGRWNQMPLDTCDSVECSEEWLAAFRDEKLKDYPRLSDVIDFVLSYHVSMSDTLAKGVTDSLVPINPNKKGYMPLDLETAHKHGFLENFTTKANFLFNSMVSVMPMIDSALIEIIKNVATIPNFSVSTRVEQLIEKISMDQETMTELQRFYITNCAILWSDDYRNEVSQDIANRVMVDWISKLTVASRKSFILSLKQ